MRRPCVTVVKPIRFNQKFFNLSSRIIVNLISTISGVIQLARIWEVEMAVAYHCSQPLFLRQRAILVEDIPRCGADTFHEVSF
jgi:hypothetical protein